MLYLVTCELKGGYPVPAEQWLEMVLASMNTIMELRTQGKVVLHGGYVGQQAGVTIWDVESNEELQRLLTQLPFWPFLAWEITPLVSSEQTIESVKQSLAAVRESKA